MAFYCDCCNFMAKCNADFQRHLKTKKHLRFTEKTEITENTENTETLKKLLNEIEPEPEPEENIKLDVIEEEEEPVFTDNDYNEMKALIEARTNKTGEGFSKKSLKPIFEMKETKYTDDYATLYSNKPTKQLGEKRLLLEKIKLYKDLFPTELKDLKINENGTMEELEGYIKECDFIISSKSIGGFLDSIILNMIQQIEEISYSIDDIKLPIVNSRIKTNIKGTADLLKKNPEFFKLTKLLYIKYQVFNQIPPEFQLVILITTTALYCRQKNANTIKNNNFLDEDI